MSDPSTHQATGSRGGARGAAGSNRDERVTTLDSTPATQQADPGAIKNAPGRASSEVVGSALREDEGPPPEQAPKPTYYRYIGDKARGFKQSSGDGRDGYTSRMQPGKILCSKDFHMKQLASQGFIVRKPGSTVGNLEEISEEEAKAS